MLYGADRSDPPPSGDDAAAPSSLEVVVSSSTMLGASDGWRRPVELMEGLTLRDFNVQKEATLQLVGRGGGKEGGGNDASARKTLEGKLAFDIITSDDVWRVILEFV